jgi:hypothetical protein
VQPTQSAASEGQSRSLTVHVENTHGLKNQHIDSSSFFMPPLQNLVQLVLPRVQELDQLMVSLPGSLFSACGRCNLQVLLEGATFKCLFKVQPSSACARCNLQLLVQGATFKCLWKMQPSETEYGACQQVPPDAACLESALGAACRAGQPAAACQALKIVSELKVPMAPVSVAAALLLMNQAAGWDCMLTLGQVGCSFAAVRLPFGGLQHTRCTKACVSHWHACKLGVRKCDFCKL